jgi:AcrR family transcriptional regulator
MARHYEQTLRAAQQKQTRRRIVEAAVELHGTIGPAATSLSAVAERAGVQRNTLYRHFPDERALIHACSGHYGEQHPFPGVEGWGDLPDPVDRARHGLRKLFAYYEEVEPMMTLVLRDADVNPNVAEVSRHWTREPLAGIRTTLLSAWPRATRRKELAAAVDLAISFHTWRTLVRGSGLTSKAGASLMATTLDCTAHLST